MIQDRKVNMPDTWKEKIEKARLANAEAVAALKAAVESVKQAQAATEELVGVTRDGPPILVDVNEAVRLLGVSRSALYRLIAKGHLHAIKVFGSMRIRRTEIETFNGTNCGESGATSNPLE